MKLAKLPVILLLVLWVNCQLPSTCYKNAYVKEREKYTESPLIFYDKPMNLQWNAEVRDKCAGEWKTYGVCCNPWDLPYHVINNERQINTAVSKLIAYFLQPDGYVRSFYALLKKLALASPHPWHPEWGRAIDVAKNFLEKGENVAMLEEFKDFPNSQEKEIFKTETTACWDQMKKFRSASLCQTCSGRSKEFFIDDRGLLTDDICSLSLTLCLRPLQLTFKFVRMVKWLLDIEDTFIQIGLRLRIGSVSNKNAIHTAFNDMSQNSELLEIIEQMSVDGVTSSPDTLKVCNEYFSLAKLPYVQKMQYLFYNSFESIQMDWAVSAPIQDSQSKINTEMPEFETILTSRLAAWRKSQPSSSRRLLQFSDSDFFTSDVTFLAPTDNMFTSVFGDEQSSWYRKPMNMSMCFP